MATTTENQGGGFTKEEAIRKIKKLHAHAENAKEIGSEAEAQTYAAAMQRLLLQYRIQMSEVQFTEYLEKEPIEKSMVDWSAHGVKFKRRRQLWIEHLASIVSTAFGCTFLVTERTNLIWLVGREASRKAAEYTLAVLVRSAHRISENEMRYYYRRQLKQGIRVSPSEFKYSFLDGFIVRVKQRFDEELRGTTDSRTAIVRVNTDLKDAAEWVAGQGVGSATAIKRHSYSVNSDGWNRGVQVANDLDLKARAFEPGEKSKPVKELGSPDEGPCTDMTRSPWMTKDELNIGDRVQVKLSEDRRPWVGVVEKKSTTDQLVRVRHHSGSPIKWMHPSWILRHAVEGD